MVRFFYIQLGGPQARLERKEKQEKKKVAKAVLQRHLGVPRKQLGGPGGQRRESKSPYVIVLQAII